MSSTRSHNPTTALIHLLEGVFKSEDDIFGKVFKQNGIQSTTDLLELSESDISTLSYEFKEGKPLRLNFQFRKRLSNVIAWYREQDEPTVASWFTLSLESFEAWREVRILRLNESNSIAAIPAAHVSNAAENFQKSVKRSLSDYKEFRDDKYWHQWDSGFRITINAHALESVLDDSYVPATADDQALFDNVQKFVFICCCK
jgi:hypothetical protein